MGRLDNIYAHLPVWAQHSAASAFGAYWYWQRFGPGYARLVRQYAERERISAGEWHAWQQQRLRHVLSLAAERVPYYQQAWGRQEYDAARAGRLDQLPLLDKAPLRADPHAFLRQDLHPRWPLVFHTSGSTGTPIKTIWDTSELRASMALREVRSARWAGASFRLPRATFSGRMVEPDPHSQGPFYRLNLAERQVYLSAFHLRPDTAAQYVAALRRHGIQWLTGYAVSYYLLAQHILAQRLPVPPLRAVVTTSEKLTAQMRAVMQAAYGCPIYEEYSTVENVLFASECEHGRLHISPDAALVEILRSDGTPCAPGEAGDVVATSLMRTYQPLIRYRVGDLAMWDGDTCLCGRQMPILKEVIGRIEDVVLGPDGRQMVRFHGVFVDLPRVVEGQIIQETLNHIRVKVVPAEGFGPDDAQVLAERVRQRLGAQVQVSVQITASIPRTSAGKFQAVVSLLDQRQTQSVIHNLPSQ
jgi:phenylacetate-coenzyme A ligase PaaK-like adenylate-forming protein